ncbi:hypothetical protein IEQ34_023041 [Dendrobium chrysotoxum]|uniref:Uncharacterized protein n=1 Tax=Dendrobium chrysotoxum TaxID=161865 RepID=A0AAV7FZH6_DENCH|nr:hypothetical protein IEQ34_023041 [Dendrobium chrysotoxum]
MAPLQKPKDDLAVNGSNVLLLGLSHEGDSIGFDLQNHVAASHPIISSASLCVCTGAHAIAILFKAINCSCYKLIYYYLHGHL